jgi:transcriptional regulator with AAA-type ATPase domain
MNEIERKSEWIAVPISGCDNELDTLWLIDGIAASRQNVLLLGKTGTGKSFLAEELYRMWQDRERGAWEAEKRKQREVEKRLRWDEWETAEQTTWEQSVQKDWETRVRKDWEQKHPFVTTNLVAAGKNLAASELFGSVKGAFNDAVDRPGAIEQANDGMLFLDELGHVEKSVQAQLLTTIQNGETRRLGSTKTISGLKIWYVAATSPPYDRILAELAYRLGYTLELRPLAEVREQIVTFADKFLREEQARKSADSRAFSERAIKFLREQEWPGNIRQLKSVVSRVVWTAAKATIEPDDIKKALDWDPTKYLAAAATGDLLSRLRELFREGAFAGTPFGRKAVLRILCEEFVGKAPTKKEAARWVGYSRTEDLDRALSEGNNKSPDKDNDTSSLE